MSATHNLMEELTLLDPRATRLYLSPFGELFLQVDGAEPAGPLRPRRAFPVSAAGEFIALDDGEGKELGVLRRVTDLDPASRAVVEAELARAYFTATITRIAAIDVEFHVPHWQVETDRGPRAFDLSSTRRDVRVLGEGRILIRDADGNLYEIPDYRQLDLPSRLLVESHI
ncbi:MAG: DUF1854 domain-containing protein [Gemmatimonadota bacterium]